MTPEQEFEEYFTDSIDNIRSVRGDAYAEALTLLYSSVAIGQWFHTAIDPRVSEEMKGSIFSKYALMIETLFMNILFTLNLDDQDYREMQGWVTQFTQKSQEKFMQSRNLH